jgi:hypothetical protein
MKTATLSISVALALSGFLAGDQIDQQLQKILEGAKIQNVIGEVFLPVQPHKGDRIDRLRLPEKSDSVPYYSILLVPRPTPDGGQERPYIRFHGKFQRIHPHVTRKGFGFSVRCGPAEQKPTDFVEATFLFNVDTDAKELRIIMSVWRVYEEIESPYGFMACLELSKEISDDDIATLKKLTSIPPK